MSNEANSQTTPSLADCLEWLSKLDEGATIWDTDLKFIFRIQTALEMLSDEIGVSNAAHAKAKADPMIDTTGGWISIPCPECGTDHRDDCLNKYPHVTSSPCPCTDGCSACDWTGVRMWTEGGHQKVRRVNNAQS